MSLDPTKLVVRTGEILEATNGDGRPFPERLDEATEQARTELKSGRAINEERTSWAPVELEAVLAGERLVDPPTLLRRTDDECLVYGDRIHSVFGEPETGKGWLVAELTAECIARGQHVLYLDFETEPGDVIERLRALGVADEEIGEFLHYARPDEPLDTAGWEDLGPVLALRPALAVVDGMTDALTLHGVKLQDNTEVAQWMRDVPRQLKARSGGAVVTVDHVTKNRETRGGYQLGAQHKRAGSEVTYEVVLKEPIGRGMKGEIKLRVRKDRPGYVRPLAHDGWVANIELDSDPEGPMHITVRAPEENEHGSDAFRPTHLMRKVSRAVEDEPGLSVKGIRGAVPGKGEYVDRARECLVREGYLEVRPVGTAQRHHSLRPFTEEDAGEAE